MRNKKRLLEEKTIGLDLLIHNELKRLAKERKVKMKDLLMNIFTSYITAKNV
jgi:hypothetical protein